MARFGEIHDPRTHQLVELQRRVRIHHRIAVHLRLKGLSVHAVSHSEDLKRVCNGLAAAGVDEGRLIGQGDHRPGHMKMSDVGRQILRLDHRCCEMDHIVVLRHP